MSARLVRPRRTGVASLATLALTSVVSVVGVAALAGPAHADVPDFTPAAPGTVFVSDIWQGQVLAVAPDGTKSTYVSGVQPYGLAVDANGDLFIAQENNDVAVIAPDGTRTDLTFNTVSNALQVAVDGDGNVYVADPGNHQVVEMTPGGTETQVPFTGLSYPEGVTVDSAGAVYTSDQGNARIEKITTDGTQTDFATGLSCPMGLTTDADDNVYVADECAGDVVKYTPDGTGTPVGFQNTRNPATPSLSTRPAPSDRRNEDDFIFESAGAPRCGRRTSRPRVPCCTTIRPRTSTGSPSPRSAHRSRSRSRRTRARRRPSATGTTSPRPAATPASRSRSRSTRHPRSVCSVVSHLDSSGTVRLLGTGDLHHRRRTGRHAWLPGRRSAAVLRRASRGGADVHVEPDRAARR